MTPRKFIDFFKDNNFEAADCLLAENPKLGNEFTKDEFFELVNEVAKKAIKEENSVIKKLLNGGSNYFATFLTFEDFILIIGKSSWISVYLISDATSKIASLIDSLGKLSQYCQVDRSLALLLVETNLVSLFKKATDFITFTLDHKNAASLFWSIEKRAILKLFSTDKDIKELEEINPDWALEASSLSSRYKSSRISTQNGSYHHFFVKTLATISMLAGGSLLVIGILALDPLSLLLGASLLLAGIGLFKRDSRLQKMESSLDLKPCH